MVNDINSEHVAPSIGHILRNARIAKGMSIEDVSRKLRLSFQQIEVIERENFEKLPGRTFLRGFIRNYANLVELDSAPLLQMLPESAQTVSFYERTIFRDKQISLSSSQEKSISNRIAILSILFTAILGAYFVLEDINWDRKLNNNFISGEIKQNTKDGSNKTSQAGIQINKDKHSEIGFGIKTEEFTFPIQTKPFIQELERPVAVSIDSGNLYFQFSEDSWVKVIDGNGISLLEQLKKKGSDQSITGKRPLSIVIGNAAGVNLNYNDTEVDIFSYKKRDGTARLTLQ